MIKHKTYTVRLFLEGHVPGGLGNLDFFLIIFRF